MLLYFVTAPHFTAAFNHSEFLKFNYLLLTTLLAQFTRKS